jgi:hypothetical protein
MAIKQIFKRLGDFGSSFKKVFKSSDSKVIKTTSKLGAGSASAVSGGRSTTREIASNFAKGAGTKANVAGKVVATTGLVAIPAGVGLYGYDLFKKTMSRQPEYYQTADAIDLYENETGAMEDRAKVLDDIQNSDSTNDGNLFGYDGALKGGSFLPEGVTSDSKPMSPYAWLGAGLVALGIGAYIFTNKKGSKK